MSHNDTPQDISDEILNAYLDDELDNADRLSVLEALQNDETVVQRLSELERVRSMIRIAYESPETGNYEVKQRFVTRRLASIAAGLLLAVGFTFGWMTHSNQSGNGLTTFAQGHQPIMQLQQDETWRVLLHVTSDDPYRLKVVLDETESILQEFEAKNQKVSIQVLANGKGLNLLRDGTSPYAMRINNLQNKYDNIAFVACAKAIERLEQKKGIKVELLPNTQIAPSAVNEVLKRQREGWTYIRI